MNDSMVTARIAPEKKAAVARILAEHRTTPSELINNLYDWVLEHNAIPFQDDTATRYSMEDVLEAMHLVESLMVDEDSSFYGKSYDEIRRERLASEELR